MLSVECRVLMVQGVCLAPGAKASGASRYQEGRPSASPAPLFQVLGSRFRVRIFDSRFRLQDFEFGILGSGRRKGPPSALLATLLTEEDEMSTWTQF